MPKGVYKRKKRKKVKQKKSRDFSTTKNVTGTIYYLIMIGVGLIILLALLGINIFQFGG